MQRYERYKDSGIEWLGEIPAHWQVKKLKYCVQINNGQDYKPVISESGVPVFGSGGQFAFANRHVYDGEVVLLGRKGTIDKPMYFVGKFWAVDTVFYAIIRQNYCGKFIYYVTKTIPYTYYSTSTALPSMTQTDLNNNEMVLPPLAEQEKIAAYLDTVNQKIDRAVAQKERVIELLNERRQIVIQRAVTRGLNPDVPLRDSGIDWIGQIPAHWQVKKLKHLLVGRLQYGANESGIEYEESLPRYIRITDFSFNGKLNDDTKLSLSNEKAKGYMLKDQDVLFARSGATVGKTYIYKEYMAINKCCFAGYLIKAETNKGKLYPDYLYLYTSSPIFEFWKSFIFNKATIENIGADKYSNLPVVLPPLVEQEEIAAYLDTVNQKIDRAVALKREEIEKLKEYKQTLINSAVTGKIKIA